MKVEERCLCGWEGVQEPAWTCLETGGEGTEGGPAVGAGELEVPSTGPPSFGLRLRACWGSQFEEKKCQALWGNLIRDYRPSPRRNTHLALPKSGKGSRGACESG